jgi:hypothetical protein
MIDKAMITCSVIELSFVGITGGFHAMTIFQVTMAALLLAKAGEVAWKLWTLRQV